MILIIANLLEYPKDFNLQLAALNTTKKLYTFYPKYRNNLEEIIIK